MRPVLLVLGWLLMVGCASKRPMELPPLPHVELINAKAYVQKAFPGVSGEVWYFVNYRIEFDLETEVPVQFAKIQADDLEIVVNSVQVGNSLLQSAEKLHSDTSGVKVHGTFPVKLTEHRSKGEAAPGVPEKLTLYFEAEGKIYGREISNIIAEPNEYRPGINRPED